MFFKKASIPIKVTEPINININQTSDAYLYAACDKNVVAAFGIVAAAGVATTAAVVLSGIERLKIKRGCGKYKRNNETVEYEETDVRNK